MTTISVVCFDAFGTLIQYAGPRTNPYRHLIQQSRVGRSERLPLLTRNVTPAELVQERGLLDMLPDIEAGLTVELAGLRLFPEVESVMQALRAAGKGVAVCSNLAQGYGATVRRLLPGLDAYILSYEVGVAKPDPTIYRIVCDRLNCHPDEVLFVGDSQRCDYHGPLAFGMKAQWLDREGGQTLLEAIKTHL